MKNEETVDEIKVGDFFYSTGKHHSYFKFEVIKETKFYFYLAYLEAGASKVDFINKSDIKTKSYLQNWQKTVAEALIVKKKDLERSIADTEAAIKVYSQE